jgi:hypothetical protein
MAADGDLDKIFSNPNYPLSAFFRTMSPPNEMLYGFDSLGMTMLVWFERFSSGVFLGAYFRPDKRQCRETDEAFRRILKSGVDAYGTIVNMTWQERLTPIHLAMGYVLAGRIPALFNGRDALIFSCNRETFDAAEARGRAADAVTPTGQERRWRDMILAEMNGVRHG